MSRKLSWWVTAASPPDQFSAEDVRFYTGAFSGHYHPAPYRAYLGPDELADVVPDRNDIVVLGDSTVVSSGLCERLQELAGSRSRPVTFHNFGITAANSAMSLARIVHELIHIRPRAIVVSGGGSDILTPIGFDPRPGYPHLQLIYDLLFEHRFQASSRSMWIEDEPLPPDELRRRFLERLTALRRETDYMSDAWARTIVTNLTANVEKMARICAAWDVPLLYVLQPAGVFKATLGRSENEALPPPESRAHITRQFTEASRAIHALDVWVPGQAELADLHAMFVADEAEAFRDIIHIRPAAVGRMAEAIVGRLDAAGWLA